MICPYLREFIISELYCRVEWGGDELYVISSIPARIVQTINRWGVWGFGLVDEWDPRDGTSTPLGDYHLDNDIEQVDRHFTRIVGPLSFRTTTLSA